MIEYLEHHLVDHCNCNCAGCSHFSPLADPWFENLEDFKRDFKKLSEMTEVQLIRLMGGEPLLHPQVGDFLKITRELFPKSQIQLVTNGLLLKKRKLENALSEEERKDNYNRFLNPDFLSFEKNDINHNEPSKHTKLTKIISIENYFETKKDEKEEKDNNSTIKNKNHENSRNSNQNSNLDINLDIEKKLSHKNSFNSEDIFIPQIIPPQKKEDNKSSIFTLLILIVTGSFDSFSELPLVAV